jgi:hypothetical protein
MNITIETMLKLLLKLDNHIENSCKIYHQTWTITNTYVCTINCSLILVQQPPIIEVENWIIGHCLFSKWPLV